MPLRILYLDLHALLYSIDYLNKHEDVFDSFKSQKPFCSTDTFLLNVEPDRLGAQKLAAAAFEAGLLLYCIFRSIPISHFGIIRSPISV
ncbi:hypothetical protein CRN40_12040 [Vibrio vulnificus]|nr:hypothetical protein CRN40_12040 [Vibrio vulnificus]